MSTRQSFRIIAADHTGITVANLDRAVAFLAATSLVFELSHRAHQTGELAGEITGVPGAEISLAVLKAPSGHKIELLGFTDSSAGPETTGRYFSPCDVGSAHVALTVDDLDGVLGASTPCVRAGRRRANLRRSSRARTPGSGSSTSATPTGQRSSSCSRRCRIEQD